MVKPTDEQSELLPPETKDIIKNMRPATRKLLEDMDDETYKEIASEVISIAQPLILAKVRPSTSTTLNAQGKPDREKMSELNPWKDSPYSPYYAQFERVFDQISALFDEETFIYQEEIRQLEYKVKQAKREERERIAIEELERILLDYDHINVRVRIQKLVQALKGDK